MNKKNPNLDIEKTVLKTRKLNLCLSCEICAAVCPQKAITMEFSHGQFLPKIDKKKCNHCGLCLQLCPGIDLLSFKDKKNSAKSLARYTGFAKDLKIRKKSTSGGLITAIITKLIKEKEFATAFVLKQSTLEDKPPRLQPVSQQKDILAAAGSKYFPSSVYQIIKKLQKKDKKKYIIVGTPCQFLGIRKFINYFKTPQEHLLFLGLFCDKNLNFNFLKYLEKNYKKGKEKLSQIEFRSKEKNGWPGGLKLTFNSGRKLFIDREVRIFLKQFFQLNRCFFCFDKLNRLSDISFGDCYVKTKANCLGVSSIIVRTKKGERMLKKCSPVLSLERENTSLIEKSQKIAKKTWNYQQAKNFNQNKKLKKLQNKALWGQNYQIRKIKTALFYKKVKNKIKGFIGRSLPFFVFAEGLVYFIRPKSKKGGKNILIFGGELFNKGAQAMTFTAIDQLKKKFPNKEIYLFSSLDFERDEKEKKIFNFQILPWNWETKFRILADLNKTLVKNSDYGILEKKIVSILKNSKLIIDISGYALSSQWGNFSWLNYLVNIIIAKKYSIPYYIFPQSIGPFDYPIKHKTILYPLIWVYFKYPKKIFVREKQGFNLLKKFTQKNLQMSTDIVLHNKNYDPGRIYKKPPLFKKINIKKNSVAIIPNARIIKRANEKMIYLSYKLLIQKLLKDKKTVYLLSYAPEDKRICIKIKAFFKNDNNVKLLDKNINSLQLETILGKFDFVAASRYHSIIQAYKNGVPALVFGWAEKYKELAKRFNQINYFFDTRKKIDKKSLLKALVKLTKNYQKERRQVKKIFNLLKKENVFQYL